VHIALVKGKIDDASNPLVRVHIEDTLGDLLGVLSPELGWPLRSAIERIAREDCGVIVVLRDQETARDLIDAIDQIGRSKDDLRERRSGDEVLRTYGVGAQILRDLGLHRMRVLSAPKQMYGISGFGLEISEYVEK
jgi:3,4-dihydroxy 2-butanone 4-phosphate synthase/GTP cyclohydrolase II